MKTGQRIEVGGYRALYPRVYEFLFVKALIQLACLVLYSVARVFKIIPVGRYRETINLRRMTENALAQCRVRAKRQIVTEQKKIPKRNGMDTDKIVESNARFKRIHGSLNEFLKMDHVLNTLFHLRCRQYETFGCNVQ